MTIYVLIMVSMINNGYAMHTQEFSSKAACEMAENGIHALIESSGTERIKTTCYSSNLRKVTDVQTKQEATVKEILIVSELPERLSCNTVYAVKTDDPNHVRFYYTTQDTIGLREVTDKDERMEYMDLLLRGATSTEDDGKWWL